MDQENLKAMWPIIYVRGYAMTQNEINETTADPFCGFNLGSAVYRATPDKKAPARKFLFESSVVRLGIDFGYCGVFQNGSDIVDPDWDNKKLPRKSIVIYRYYEPASGILGTGKTPPIERFGEDLGKLIMKVRDLVCADPGNKIAKTEDFRCYLVAHSMGGLVCRAFLQHPDREKDGTHKYVDKFFTYATPHNGIDMAGINIPSWLKANDIDNFNRDRMAKYLNLGALYKEGDENARVDWLPEEVFPSGSVFCMVGTNRSDYEAGAGLSRAFAGHGSDGLVRIENASVWGVNKEGKPSGPSATAYAYRAHSGFYGIVNSEEAYQNLTRFLFGDLRVDVWLDITDVRLPPEVQKAWDNKPGDVQALYQFEVLASPRGKRWFLTRRVAEEDSVACRTLTQLKKPQTPGDSSIYLSTLFLANRAKVDPNGKSLAYSVTLGARVPDYEIEGRFWGGQHFEGGNLFRDAVIIEIFPPEQEDGSWNVVHYWQSKAGEQKQLPVSTKALNGKVELIVPVDAPGAPGITGRLRFVASGWNR